jgi:hypothetical protein
MRASQDGSEGEEIDLSESSLPAWEIEIDKWAAKS